MSVAALVDLEANHVRGWSAIQPTTRGLGVGLMSSESTFVFRMIIRQISGPDASGCVAATRIRARQTPQIAGDWPPLGSPFRERKRSERNPESLWLLPPSNDHDAPRGPSTGFWSSRQVVEWSMSPTCQCYHCSPRMLANPRRQANPRPQMPYERAFTKKPTSMTWSWNEPRPETKRSSTQSHGR
jgi:hypothetical protein